MMTYQEYLQSDQWKIIRKEVVIRAGFKCQMCGWVNNENRYGLQVHHNTYENIGCERDEDLVALCNRCHDVFHRHLSLRSKIGKITQTPRQWMNKHDWWKFTDIDPERTDTRSPAEREAEDLDRQFSVALSSE